MINRKQLIEVYWKEGNTLEVTAQQFNYTRSGLSHIMRRLGVPTFYSLIVNFCDWYQELGEEEMKKIFRCYLQMRSPAEDKYRRWINITCKNRESLECIEGFLENLGVNTHIGDYKSRNSFYLRIKDKDIDTLSSLFNLSWYK